MLGWLLFTLALGQAEPAGAAPAAAPEASESLPEIEQLTFIGFSMGENEAAWRVRVKSVTPAGDVDRYTVATVVDVYSGQATASYRLSDIRRTDAQGRHLSTPEPALAAANPRWAEAEPYAAWRKKERRSSFDSKRLKASDTTLRLTPDPDVKLEAEADDKGIVAETQPAQPIGYDPILRLLTGDTVSLGHLRLEARPGASYRATVEVFFSHSGMKVAIVNRVNVLGPNPDVIFSPNLVRLPSPVGTTEVGNANLSKSYWNQAGDSFKQMNPDMADLYDRLVGGMK